MAVVSVVRSLLGPLVRVPQERPRQWYEVIVWWELRRIPYNVISAVVVFACIMGIFFVDSLPPRLPPEQLVWSPGFSAFGGAILANFFYTGGWVCEIVLRSLTRRQIRWFGPTMFTLGLSLTLGPLILGVVFDTLWWLSRVVTRA
jgi:hypothetical protein